MCLKLLEDSCSEAMMRLFGFILNFIFILVGVILCVLGIWMEIEYVKIENLTENNFGATPAAVGIVGALTLLVASFGLWGIVRKGKCLTGTYAVALIVLLLVQIAGIVAPIVARDQAEELLYKSANQTMMEWEGPNKPIGKAWGVVQTKFECCGVSNGTQWIDVKGFVDYAKKHGWDSVNGTADPVPDSCCVTKSENCGLTYTSPASIFQDGCVQKMESWAESHMKLILGCVGGLCALELITVVMSFWLVRGGYSYESLA
jgi:vacuolar-type H+-ATPase subunit I/STV1